MVGYHARKHFFYTIVSTATAMPSLLLFCVYIKALTTSILSQLAYRQSFMANVLVALIQ